MIKNKKKSNAGRPTVMTPTTLGKLEQAFALGMNDTDACFYAEIAADTLYEYQKKHPEFIGRKQALKAKPVMKAYSVINAALDAADTNTAKWLLERKRKDEFTAKTEIIQPEPVKIYVTAEQEKAALEHIEQVINSGS